MAALGDHPAAGVSPHLVELTQDVLFGDVWERTELSKRDRSIATLRLVPIAKFRTDELRSHIHRALDNDVTEAEIGELICHLAFYRGWPAAASAVNVAEQAFEEQPRATLRATARCDRLLNTGPLDGRVALISGAARGQGEAEARAFAAEGAVSCSATCSTTSGTRSPTTSVTWTYAHLDVSSERDWEAAMVGDARRRRPARRVGEQRGESSRSCRLTDLQPRGLLECIRRQPGRVLPRHARVSRAHDRERRRLDREHLVDQRHRRRHTLHAVCRVKFAIRGMTETAAMELGPLGIRVNSIDPGAIDTDMAREGLEALDVDPFTSIPISRIGRPEEVAELAVFLDSDDPGYCTGGEFVIDGGWIAGVSL